MKAVVYSIVFSLVLLGCGKDDRLPSGTQNPIYNIPVQTDVTGLKDFTMKQNDVMEIPVSVKYISGIKEKVSIALINMPDSLFASITPQIDTPGYTSTIRFISKNADTGTSTVSLITAASNNSSSKTYSFKITVVADPANPAMELVGDYNETGACTNVGNVNNTVRVSIVNGVMNRIRLQGVWTGNQAYYFIADINPTAHTLTIPPQSNGNITYSGSGTYSSGQMDIHYQFSDGNLLQDECTTTLVK